MIPLASTIRVATDWPAFGLFFIGFITCLGGFTAWVLNRLDKNRADWKQFVSDEVKSATSELTAQVGSLTEVVAENTRELRVQGQAIARIEGRLSVAVPVQGD